MEKPVIEFELPAELEAHLPPELRGLRRDQVRLLVLPRVSGEALDTQFDALGEYLAAGDLLVVNNSRTLPALLLARDENGAELEVRLATHRADNLWEALLLRGHTHVGQAGMRLAFGQDLSARVLGPSREHSFLWQVEFDRCCAELLDLIYRLGYPIHYNYIENALPLDFYQTVYAAQPGSVEMASAGRPLTWELLLKLRRKGIDMAAISLHTGLSSMRDDAIDDTHPNFEEEFDVPEATAQAINACHARHGRVIAVGTTVVRALETVSGPDGNISAVRGRTRLRINSAHRLRAVDALLTGMHEPSSTHLDLLSAFVDPLRLKTAYQQAIEKKYLWHEFGDMNLII